jgi:hypothetical protein
LSTVANCVMPNHESTLLPAGLLMVGAAVALATVMRILLLCGVMIWSIARVLCICLEALCDAGTLIIDRTLRLSENFSQNTIARWTHR